MLLIISQLLIVKWLRTDKIKRVVPSLAFMNFRAHLMLLSMVAAAFFGTSVNAQTKANEILQGVVRGKETQAPLEGIEVIVKNRPNIGAVTDSHGRYAIRMPGPSDSLKFQGVAYNDTTVEARPDLEIMLTMSIHETQSISVDAEYGERLPGRISLDPREKVFSLGGNDPRALVLDNPSVTTTGPGRIFIYGGDEVDQEIDGIPFRPIWGGFSFPFPSSILAGSELHSLDIPLRYGHGDGVFSARTKAPADPEAEVSLSTNGADAYLADTYGDLSYLLAAQKMTYAHIANIIGEDAQLPGAQNIFASMRFRPGPLQLRLDVLGSGSSVSYSGIGELSSEAFDVDQDMRFTGIRAALSYVMEGGILNIHYLATGRDESLMSGSVDEKLDISSDVRSQQYGLRFRFDDVIDIDLGGNFGWTDMSFVSDSDFNTDTESGSRPYPAGKMVFEENTTVLDRDMYAELSGGIGDLSGVMGFRVEHGVGPGGSFRISLGYEPSDFSFQAALNTHQGFKDNRDVMHTFNPKTQQEMEDWQERSGNASITAGYSKDGLDASLIGFMKEKSFVHAGNRIEELVKGLEMKLRYKAERIRADLGIMIADMDSEEPSHQLRHPYPMRVEEGTYPAPHSRPFSLLAEFEHDLQEDPDVTYRLGLRYSSGLPRPAYEKTEEGIVAEHRAERLPDTVVPEVGVTLRYGRVSFDAYVPLSVLGLGGSYDGHTVRPDGSVSLRKMPIFPAAVLTIDL